MQLKKELPTLETLNEFFIVEDDILKWKKPNCKQMKAGDSAGCTNAKGYLRVFLNYQVYMVHRIIWKMVTGDDPDVLEIDHINKNRSDNRMENLRLVTHVENVGNSAVVKPDIQVERSGRYRVRICKDGKRRSLGTYATYEEALDVYKKERWGSVEA